ncbi:hypothetical protein A3A75_03910 [Candidatus Woesebacteria bacterium RIFCSPLOWO2_01_FULL_39_10]|uniref:Uncharacterized protein n=1 Tax=Candidatus Woesebacteria bacterium RIFCSPLOWO2_01_FULL_39_10 TaxID=1802516 RepID=A0A1F8B5C9_9BACT|nr:MAG: hypothetical protein A3A75_03910 [Candidatus Woesebacteria bacterium RIFCSPLOWO2_01_FULL_39_10]
MVYLSGDEDIQNVVSSKTGNSKNSKKVIIILVGLFFVITISTAIVLFIKFKYPQIGFREDAALREEIPDLYTGKSIEIEEPLFVRARFGNLDSNKLSYGIFNPVGNSLKEITLNSRTVFGCTPRYITAPDGVQLDRLNMYITTGNKTDIGDIPDPPDAKDLKWFKGNVQSGEAIEIRFVRTQEGTTIPRIIYVYKNSCST